MFSCKLKGDVFKMKNKNFNKYGSSHADIFAELLAEIFAGNGKNIHAEGLAFGIFALKTMWNCSRI